MTFNWTGVWLATGGSLLLGVGIAYWVARHLSGAGRAILPILIFLLVIPTVVLVGLRWRAGLIPAGAAAGTPLVALTTLVRFRIDDRKYGNTARSLGASEWRIFWRVLTPQAWRWMAFATLVAWLRIVAECAIVSAL